MSIALCSTTPSNSVILQCSLFVDSDVSLHLSWRLAFSASSWVICSPNSSTSARAFWILCNNKEVVRECYASWCVTCTSSLTTQQLEEKWRRIGEKEPRPVAYALTRSFSHASHWDLATSLHLPESSPYICSRAGCNAANVASECYASCCVPSHRSSLRVRVLSGCSIAAHPWPYIYGDWRWRIVVRS